MKHGDRNWVLLGNADVDSGQLIVMDPVYLSGWGDNDAPGHEIIEDTWTKQKYQLLCSDEERDIKARVFNSYAEIIPEFGQDMTALLKTDRFQRIPWPYPQDQSYRGACMATNSKKRGGQIGSGVAFSSGYGDGCYEVWGRKDHEGRIVEVRILMEDKD